MAIRLSCIIPVYNGAALIGEALDSIAAQTQPPDEVFVVDDGSTDGSAEVALAHPIGVRVLRANHKGPGHARNVGIAASHGEFIAFLDADDVWLPGKCAAETTLLAERPEVDLVVSRIENFIDPATPLSGDSDWRLALMGPNTSLFVQATTVRRAALDRIGVFDESIRPFGEDTDWFIRVVATGAKMERMDTIHTRRRLHGANVTRNFDNPARVHTALGLMARHLQRKRAAGNN